jgi:type II secretory pathway pseudopilin PulG
MNRLRVNADSHLHQRGFTYLWVMLMVGLMGLGLLTAAELYSMSLRRDRERDLMFIGRQFRSAIRQYAIAHGQQYPDSLQALLLDPAYPGVKRYLRRLYVDPMTGKADWALIEVAGRVVGVHSRSIVAPFKVDNFEPAEAHFKDAEHYAQWTFTYPPNLIVPDDGSPIKGLQTVNLAAMEASGVPVLSASAPTDTAGSRSGGMTPASNVPASTWSW